MGEALKTTNEPKGNVASGSKGKDPMIDANEDDETKENQLK